MLATRISFMNELANLAEIVGADIEMVRQGIGSDPRIGFHFLYPGCGYGGSCFPKDVKALERTAKEQGYHAELLNAVENVNNRQKNRLFEKISTHYQGKLEGKVFALWGHAFEPDTDDMREAPSRVVIESLCGAGATVQAYDPEALAEAKRIYGDNPRLKLCTSPQNALENAVLPASIFSLFTWHIPCNSSPGPFVFEPGRSHIPGGDCLFTRLFPRCPWVAFISLGSQPLDPCFPGRPGRPAGHGDSAHVLFPPSGSHMDLITLPGPSGPRVLNRLFDEQDIVLFGAKVAPSMGFVSRLEYQSLLDNLSETYRAMAARDVTSLSPALTTYLGWQHPDGFDALIAAPGSVTSRTGIIFLHGYGGNFTLQCWLVARAGEAVNALTLCPSTDPSGQWWNEQGTSILQESINYLQQRGVERIYLAGLSNGGIGPSRLAEEFKSDLTGLILISRADPGARIIGVPVLVIHGQNDGRIPASITRANSVLLYEINELDF